MEIPTNQDSRRRGLSHALKVYVDAPKWASGIQIGSKSRKRAQRPFTLSWFFRSRLVDRLPLPVPASGYPHLPDSFFAFRFSPFTARSGGGASPVGLLSRCQCPDLPRHLVGERHRDHLLWVTNDRPGSGPSSTRLGRYAVIDPTIRGPFSVMQKTGPPLTPCMAVPSTRKWASSTMERDLFRILEEVPLSGVMQAAS